MPQLFLLSMAASSSYMAPNTLARLAGSKDMTPYWAIYALITTANGNLAQEGGTHFPTLEACEEYAAETQFVLRKDPAFAGTIACLEITDKHILSLMQGEWK